jgi:hypothetical protein
MQLVDAKARDRGAVSLTYVERRGQPAIGQ